jgi:hypothetical protein
MLMIVACQQAFSARAADNGPKTNLPDGRNLQESVPSQPVHSSSKRDDAAHAFDMRVEGGVIVQQAL